MRALLPVALVCILAVPCVGATPPPGMQTPISLVLSNVAEEAVLVWTPVFGTQLYDVYRAVDGGSPERIAMTIHTFYVDKELPQGDLSYFVTLHGGSLPPANGNQNNLGGVRGADGGGGSCISMTTDLHWDINVQDCLS